MYIRLTLERADSYPLCVRTNILFRPLTGAFGIILMEMCGSFLAGCWGPRFRERLGCRVIRGNDRLVS